MYTELNSQLLAAEHGSFIARGIDIDIPGTEDGSPFTLNILVQGIAINRGEEGYRYADACWQWNGHKLDDARFAAGYVDHDAKSPVRKIHEMFICNIITDRNDKPDNPQLLRSSFKQNRALFQYRVVNRVKRIDFDTSRFGKETQGFFRIQVFIDDDSKIRGHELDEIVHDKQFDRKLIEPRSTMFEWYLDEQPNASEREPMQLGYRVGVESFGSAPASSAGSADTMAWPFSGDFLLPVGFASTPPQTERVMDNLMPFREYRVRVSGAFLFSGTCPGERKRILGELRHHDGGGGGIQDAAWRLDHLANPFRGEFNYRTNHWISKISNPVELRFLGATNEYPRPMNNNDRASNPWHEYEFVVTPKSDKVVLFIEDGWDTFMTLDNVGALQVQWWPEEGGDRP